MAQDVTRTNPAPGRVNGGAPTREQPVFLPRADIYETENEVVVLADMPGVSPGDVDITLEQGVLTISGHVPPAVHEGYRQIYSESEEGLEQEFNSLEAQREACAAHIKSQAGEGWQALATRYDHGGFSGGSMDRPALARLLLNIEAGRIDVVVVYKIDRLTRSLPDFARIIEIFDRHGVSFISVTQAFNTTTSMGGSR
jgi:hypothetical protein